jgi:glycosyltransferase involved in cell wall biosynthesis
MAHLLTALSAANDVAAVCLRLGEDDGADGEEVRLCCEVVEVVDAGDGRTRRGPVDRLRRRVVPFVSTPAWATAVESARYAESVQRVAATFRPDIVHVVYQVMAPYAGALDRCAAPRVLTVYEPATAAARDQVTQRRGLRRLRARLEAAAWQRFERRAFNAMDGAVVLTARDGLAIAPVAGAIPTFRVPLGVAPRAALDPRGAEPPTLLFVGNFMHPPNVDAALWLMREIFPRIAAVHPTARLHIVGPRATPAMARLAGGRVVLAGAVASVEPILDCAAVVVAPIRTGGGMRVKVLDALAAGKAVVATSRAAEGIDVEPEHHLLVADDAELFARRVCQLLADPGGRAAMAQRARAHVMRTMSWAGVAAAYDDLHGTILRDRSLRRGRR